MELFLILGKRELRGYSMNQIPDIYIYIAYTGFLGVLMLLIVPKDKIRSLAIPAIIYGAVLDVFAIVFLFLIKASFYQGFGPFGIGFLPFFPVISWTAYFMIYLYLLPEGRPWSYIFALLASVYSTFFANILDNLGIFKLTYSNYLLPFTLYLSWHIFTTWSYLKYFKKISLYEDGSNKLKIIRRKL